MMCAAFGTSQSLFGATSTSAVRQVPEPRLGMYNMDKLSFFIFIFAVLLTNLSTLSFYICRKFKTIIGKWLISQAAPCTFCGIITVYLNHIFHYVCTEMVIFHFLF